jgi:hypothetical protein
MDRKPAPSPTFLVLALALFAGCSSNSATGPLALGHVNLIFVVSEDLAHNAPGDVDPVTANLTSKGLQRSLLLATFLQQWVLGTRNVTAIHALEPMTHLQTANRYPDMTPLLTVQQFALLNRMTMFSGSTAGSPGHTGHGFPIQVSDSACCQGLRFADDAANEALLARILQANVPGFYVFSAPWETTRALLASAGRLLGQGLDAPTSYVGPDLVHTISVAPSGAARLVTYDARLDPPSGYPVLDPPPPLLDSCQATPFRITATGGVDGVVVPPGINRNETVYLVRHAEAHPTAYYANGNYVGAGQWRALYLPDALRGKVQPDQVISIDPAQVSQGGIGRTGNTSWSNVAPSLTVLPYAIASGLPYDLIWTFQISSPDSPRWTSDLLFTGGRFTGRSVLLGWQYTQIPQTIEALLATYGYTGPPPPAWSPVDYDSVWTVTIDAGGNLTVDNATCEGIDSAGLPTAPPWF